jgi:hypothetical protein
MPVAQTLAFRNFTKLVSIKVMLKYDVLMIMERLDASVGALA